MACAEIKQNWNPHLMGLADEAAETGVNLLLGQAIMGGSIHMDQIAEQALASYAGQEVGGALSPAASQPPAARTLYDAYTEGQGSAAYYNSLAMTRAGGIGYQPLPFGIEAARDCL